MIFGDSSHKTVKISDCFWSLGPNRSPNRNGANQNKKIILKVLPVAPIKAEKIISNDKWKNKKIMSFYFKTNIALTWPITFLKWILNVFITSGEALKHLKVLFVKIIKNMIFQEKYWWFFRKNIENKK